MDIYRYMFYIYGLITGLLQVRPVFHSHLYVIEVTVVLVPHSVLWGTPNLKSGYHLIFMLEIVFLNFFIVVRLYTGYDDLSTLTTQLLSFFFTYS